MICLACSLAHGDLLVREFGQAEEIFVGILEPGDQSAGGRGPDSLNVLLEKAVSLKADPGRFELGNRGTNVRHIPAENRTRQVGALLADGGAQHDAVGIEDERKGKVFAHQGQAEGVAIERAGFVDVDDVHECDEILFSKVDFPGHGLHDASDIRSSQGVPNDISYR